MPKTPRPSGLHPIQVVARRAGISPDVLRAWEKRYQAVSPVRSDTGRRRYSDADIARLRLIREAMAGGRRISEVARLPDADLEAMVARDREAGAMAPTLTAPAAVETILRDALEAARRADQQELRTVLSRALFLLPPRRFVVDLATPFMHELGARWVRGDLSPGHEHAATEVMRQLLTEVLRLVQPAGDAPALVVGTPAGQRHEIGALLAATSAAIEGWRVTYLGPDLPAQDIARVALDTGARAVALSVTFPDPALTDELARLRKALGHDTPILLGGQGADQLNGTARHVASLRDLDAFQEALAPLQAG